MGVDSRGTTSIFSCHIDVCVCVYDFPHNFQNAKAIGIGGRQHCTMLPYHALMRVEYQDVFFFFVFSQAMEVDMDADDGADELDLDAEVCVLLYHTTTNTHDRQVVPWPFGVPLSSPWWNYHGLHEGLGCSERCVSGSPGAPLRRSRGSP